MSLAYKVTEDKDNITIRLPRKSIDQKALEKLLDYLELESVQRHSQLSELDATSLASKVKEGAWKNIKNLFEK